MIQPNFWAKHELVHRHHLRVSEAKHDVRLVSGHERFWLVSLHHRDPRLVLMAAVICARGRPGAELPTTKNALNFLSGTVSLRLLQAKAIPVHVLPAKRLLGVRSKMLSAESET